MSVFLEKRELFDQVLLLTQDEMQDPAGVFEHFFSDYRLHECRYILWAMVQTCLTTDNTHFSNPEERADLLLRYEDLQRLLEAATLLIKKQEK
jgi:hypothetical protein